ncbi:sigma-70 family RNA polymerase sigma factor [Nonomuraea ferruginea]
MTRAEEFQELRPLLFSIAYRILGSVGEAEDAVQEAWLRYDAYPGRPASAKAFLAATVSRIAIDVLRSARVRREQYTGRWFPEPLLADPYEDPERSAELADSLSMAALLLLERLSPLERAVFVLREVFGFGFGEVAAAVGRSEAACRQLAVRARRHMEAGRARFETDRRERDELAGRFFDAFRDGDVDGLRDLLAADVRMVGDSGGNAPLWGTGVFGARQGGQGPGRDRRAVRPHRRRGAAARGQRPAGRDLPRPGRQDRQHPDPRHPLRPRPDDPRSDQPRQAPPPGPGRGRLGHRPRSQPSPPPHPRP